MKVSMGTTVNTGNYNSRRFDIEVADTDLGLVAATDPDNTLFELRRYALGKVLRFEVENGRNKREAADEYRAFVEANTEEAK